MKRLKRAYRLGSLILASLVWLGCGQAVEQELVVRIGFLPPSLSEWPTGNIGSRRAAHLAIEELEASGGLIIAGRRHRVALVERDMSVAPEVAMRAAQDLINRQGVAALVGPFSTVNALPVAVVAQNSLVPMIPPTATSSEIIRDRSFVFGVTFLDEFQGAVLARFAFSEVGARQAAVLFDVAEPYSRHLARLFQVEFSRLGGEIVANETFTSGETNFGPQLERIIEKSPGVLFLPTFTRSAGDQIQQARELGLTATLLGTDGWEVADFDDPATLDGSFVTDHWHPDLDSSPSRRYISSFRHRYGVLPTSSDAVLTYDSLRLLFRAFEAAGSTDGDAVRRALASIDEFAGASGRIAWTLDGDPKKSALVLRVEDGKTQLHRIFEP